MTTRMGSAVITLPSDRDILITRAFDAPANLVFEAWTTPEHVRNWWGFQEHEMTVCEIDLRIGGTWRFVSRMDDGTEVGFHGVYQEVDPPHRLVYTETFEGFEGEGGPWEEGTSLNTLTLVERDGVTTLSVLATYESKAARDEVIESGMERGLQVSFDRLERILTGDL